MLNIITGKINSFKTTRLIKVFNSVDGAEGFASIKKMENDKVLFYELENLKLKSRRIFIINTDNYPNSFTNYESLGPYVFDLDYLKEVEAYINSIIDVKVNAIFLDEIGILEVNGKFFYHILKEMIESDIELYITVRSSLLEKVISKFCISNYRILE